jgi:carbamoyltransferase
MACVLGIHLGHHSSCAVVRDGQLVSAIQTERHTRIKYHPLEAYTQLLPIQAALDAAGLRMQDVDIVVSSLQAAGAASFGLHQPLVESSFDRFDLFAPNHFVISHHLAHAHSAFSTSGFGRAALLICDYGGSTTFDGADYALPFREWYAEATSQTCARPGMTECLSIYSGEAGKQLRLVDREFAVPHCQPRSFVGSAASLYDNVTGAVFADLHGHGQLMALGAYAKEPMLARQLVTIEAERVEFRNDWQHRVSQKLSFDAAANLAQGCQEALELVVLAYARRAFRLTSVDALGVAGGVFLNILTNTRLVRESPFAQVWVPSAPHDAGVSVGCAFWGAQQAGDLARPRRVRTDRLGKDYDDPVVAQAIASSARFVEDESITPRQVAEELGAGKIFARCAGRAEFGPRALGARSLLASPCLETSKTRLNRIKGRQWWRPVAPVIQREALPHFLDGPEDSPWMTFSHVIPERFRAALPALAHPDHSTRAQTLQRDHDPWLHDLLDECAKVTGFPILVNTSLNGPGQPIIETPQQAIDWFLRAPDVDGLLLGERSLRRRPTREVLRDAVVRLDDTVVITFTTNESKRALLVRGAESIRLSPELSAIVQRLRERHAIADLPAPARDQGEELYRLIVRGVLVAHWPLTAEEASAA